MPDPTPPIYGTPEALPPHHPDGPQDLPRPRARTTRNQNLALGLGGGILALGAVGVIGTLATQDAAPAQEPVSQSRVAPKPYQAPDAAALAAQAADRQAAADRAAGKPPVRKPAEKVELGNLVGKGLAVATDDAEDAGFTDVQNHDASGRERSVFVTTNWKVCSQPAPGTYDRGKTIDLGVVKLGETCPGKDAGGPVEQAAATMPDLTGTSLAAARKSLGDDASVRTVDGRGEDRIVIVTSNWRVCSQNPRAGATFDGIPVELTVVKYGESC